MKTELPHVLQVAYFIRFYGHDAYQNPLYATSDRIIPYKQFWIMSKAMRHAMALERLNQTRATAHAIGIVMEGNNPQIKRLAEVEQKEAFGME